MSNSKWEKLYRSYRSPRFTEPSEKIAAAMFELILDGIINSPSNWQENTETVMRSNSRSPFACEQMKCRLESGLYDELSELASGFRDVRSHESSQPYDDVYQAALVMLTVGFASSPAAEAITGKRSLFRGQNDSCRTIYPSVYQEHRGGTLSSRAERADRAARMVSIRMNLSYDDALAVVQHYGARNELNTQTWLMDVTWSPWVALFFASHHDPRSLKFGSEGVVWEVFRNEYEKMTGNGAVLGNIRVSMPQAVPRIDAQAAAFVSAACPSMIAQYLPIEVCRFRQHRGVFFEDAELGITQAVIYPESDAWLDSMRAIRSDLDHEDFDCHKVTGNVPRSVYCDPYKTEPYYDLLSQWVVRYAKPEQKNIIGHSNFTRAMDYLVAFHVGVVRCDGDPTFNGKYRRASLHRLEKAMRNLIQQAERKNCDSLDLREAILEPYCGDAGGNDVLLLFNLLKQPLSK